MTPLILASTSIYRKELLSKLGISFEVRKPLFDEDSAKLEVSWLKPAELCLFLGKEKARSLANAQNCVIGSDQMLVLGSQILGKPGTVEKARAQLQQMQGREHELLTSVSVFFQGQEHSFLHRAHMKMLPLSEAQIHTYVEADQPLDCAGSYKIEKQGLALFEKI